MKETLDIKEIAKIYRSLGYPPKVKMLEVLHREVGIGGEMVLTDSINQAGLVERCAHDGYAMQVASALDFLVPLENAGIVEVSKTKPKKVKLLRYFCLYEVEEGDKDVPEKK